MCRERQTALSDGASRPRYDPREGDASTHLHTLPAGTLSASSGGRAAADRGSRQQEWWHRSGAEVCVVGSAVPRVGPGGTGPLGVRVSVFQSWSWARRVFVGAVDCRAAPRRCVRRTAGCGGCIAWVDATGSALTHDVFCCGRRADVEKLEVDKEEEEEELDCRCDSVRCEHACVRTGGRAFGQAALRLLLLRTPSKRARPKNPLEADRVRAYETLCVCVCSHPEVVNKYQTAGQVANSASPLLRAAAAGRGGSGLPARPRAASALEAAWRWLAGLRQAPAAAFTRGLRARSIRLAFSVTGDMCVRHACLARASGR